MPPGPGREPRGGAVSVARDDLVALVALALEERTAARYRPLDEMAAIAVDAVLGVIERDHVNDVYRLRDLLLQARERVRDDDPLAARLDQEVGL